MKEITANIHSIETFGTVDGPGIRFVLFLQGCHLACKYCHNKDSCSIGTGKNMTLSEILKKVDRYKEYLISSNGGVTVSGGEPLLQAEFVTEFFKALKEKGYHTALDTSGSFPISEKIKKVLEYTDLVLLDIKHIDNEKCIELTGKPNTYTLEFAKYLSDNNKPMWIRQVLVPGITDNEKDLLKLKEFLSSLNTVTNIEILPYHTMGKYKWEELGFKYELEGIPSATIEDVLRAKEILDVDSIITQK